MRGEAVAHEAIEWIGTPTKWQHRTKGIACDCKGLLWGVAGELDYPEAQSVYARKADYGDSRPVPSALLKEGMAALFDRVASLEEILPGDVLLLKLFDGKPGHIAIVTFEGRAVHARMGHKDRVSSVRIAALLKKFALDSIWRWRETTNG